MDPWSTRRDVARGILRSSPKSRKMSFLPSERDRELLSSVFYTPVDKCFCVRYLAGGRHVSPGPQGGSEPLTNASRSELMTQALFLSINVCRGLGISPLRIKHLAEFFSGRSWPNIFSGIIIFAFFGKFGTFLFGDLCL